MQRAVVYTAWLLGALAILVGAAVVFFLLFLTVTRYDPVPAEPLFVNGKAAQEGVNKWSFTLMTWNIGYAGLGKEMDFFYEGGRRVRPEEKESGNYLGGILNLVGSNDTVDFIYIQEADKDSKRSWFADEPGMLAGVLEDHCFAFAKNYSCRFVPVPANDPMGRVVSGIVTFSRYRPDTAIRYDFGTKFSWPKQLAFLQRCFLVMRFRMPDGKDLVMLNTHNSVFDEDGRLRKKELAKLNDFMSDEYGKGNYVVAGGDWNQNPRGFTAGSFINGDLSKKIDIIFDEDILRGWQFVFDPEQPTNRDVDRNYRKGITKTTIIDFFVISPNVTAESVETIASGFEYSDHQPVIMKFTLSK